MPKKKKEKVEELIQQEQANKPESISWPELDKYIGQPVWDTRENKWRVLDGYRRSGNTFAITFSDIADWVSYYDRFLYLEEVKL